MKEKHILVVDNEQHMATGIKFILSLENYKVTTAKNGKEALFKILLERENKNQFDLLITDIWMPDLTGMDMLKELKKLHIKIPTIIISALSSKEMEKELQQMDLTDFILKPFDDNKLLEKVDDILGNREIALT